MTEMQFKNSEADTFAGDSVLHIKSLKENNFVYGFGVCFPYHWSDMHIFLVNRRHLNLKILTWSVSVFMTVNLPTHFI